MKTDLQPGKIYKAPRSKKGNYYLIPLKDDGAIVYLSDDTGQIFSTGAKKQTQPFIDNFIRDLGPVKELSIDEEAKVRLLINIFHADEEH